MKVWAIVVSSVLLAGCTRSCGKSASAPGQAAPSREEWELHVFSLQPSLQLAANVATKLVLTGDKITVQQQGASLEMQVLNWEQPDFAKLKYQDKVGYFRWDVQPREKRFDDRPYRCPNDQEGDKPSGLTRVEETFQGRVVTVYLETEATKEPVFKLEALVPSQSFWVQTGSVPLAMCGQKK